VLLYALSDDICINSAAITPKFETIRIIIQKEANKRSDGLGEKSVSYKILLHPLSL